MSDKDFCPTCNAAGTAPCVTASGKPAKARHKNRTVVHVNDEMHSVGTVTAEDIEESYEDVQPESVGTIKAYRTKSEMLDDEEGTFRKVPNRADRRAQGRHKSVRNGFRNRNVRRTVNDSIRRFWHPVKKDSEADVNDSVSA